MKTLYLDCGMGAAGDMLMAALLELHPDPDGVIARLNGMGLPGVRIERTPSVKCGVTGTHVSVKIHGHEEAGEDDHDCGHEHPHGAHHHASLGGVARIIEALDLPKAVRDDALAVYRRIARAESQVHGVDVDEVHFHEVGALDAVADVAGVCLLMHELAPERVTASPVHVGCGQVILPVPAPATALILKDVPIYGGEIRGELCTPTGAALLTHFVHSFGPMPAMKVRAIGYGMGAKDFEAANCVRAMLGEGADGAPNDRIVRLECNLDDMTGEALGFAMERLLDVGAKDVYLQPIQMKKNRPGQLLACICAPEDADRLARAMLCHTTTLGVRRQDMARYALERHLTSRSTPWGDVRFKVSEGFGVKRVKPEYEDLAQIARREGCCLQEIEQSVKQFTQTLD